MGRILGQTHEAAIWCGLVLLGCNEVFGIQPTQLDEGDVDGDTVLDGRDNCRDVPNPNQEDRDHDGYGDACDGCPDIDTMDFNHDEDGDGRGDKCDVCPGAPDFGTDDIDADGLDDNCDFVTTLPSTPIMFDPFTVLDDTQWSSAGWELVGDAVAPIQPLTGDEGLEHASLTFTGTPWWLEAGFASIEEWQAGDHFGIGLADAATGAVVATCDVTCTVTGCDLAMIVNGLATPGGYVRPVPRIALVFGRGRAGADSLACAIGTQGVFGLTAALTLPPSVKPRLFASHRTRAAYVFAAR